MKTMFFYILSLFNCVMFAQTPDPYKFFPSAVGNVWEYNHTIGVYQREIIRDSVLENGSRLIYFNTLIDPAFRIDSAYKCYYDPLFLNWFYYKLDSDSGEVWIVDSLDSGAGMTYKLALCKNQYNGQIFGMSTIFKEITFYHYQSDTIIHEFSWPQFTFILAYGIGEVMQIDEEGGGPVKILQGCIIDGDTLGTITTAVEVNNSPYTLELNQNYPNPFNPATTIEFSLPESQNVKLIIYSLLGEKIKVLVDEYKTIGKHSVLFRAEGLPSGVYIYTLTTKNIIVSKKLILIK